jgi:cation diffusion facilitator family transporter
VNDGSRRAIVAAFAANLSIAVAKFVGFLLTRSAGMLAEAIHSLADTANQALLFLGSKRANRAATPEHQFGYGRERYFWAFAVALVLFSMGGLFALVEGIEKLREPHEVDNLGIAVAILLFALAAESWSLRTAVKESRHVKPKQASWWRFIRTSKQPELPVVLLEDTGALLGLLAALAGVTLSQLTGNPRWDAVGSVIIGVLLIAIAIVLVVEMKGLLIGESASPENEHRIMEALAAGPGVRSVIHLRTEHLGPEDILVASKLEFDPDITLHTVADAIDATELNVRAAVPTVRLIYIEPDVRRSAGD